MKSEAALGKKDNKNEMDDGKNHLHCPYMTLGEVLEKYGTSLKGLTREEAERRLEEYGRNELPGKKKVTIWKVLFNQLKSPLIFILIAAGILSIVISEFIEAAFIFLVIAINAGMGTFQEWRAEKSAESLQDYLEKEAITIRGGKEVSVLSSRLVPGDIVLLESGDKVPADLRLIDSKNLTLDESLLTGESLPVEKTAEVMSSENIEKELEFCTNVSFAGTTVVSGRGRGIVINTGRATEIGKIAEDVYESKEVKPPLLIRIDRFSTKIGFIVLAGTAVLGIITFFQGYGFFEVFFLSIALAVSAIPEGLPVSVTIALSLGANRMAQRNVIIRRLAAVESLGSCTLIASDKTGTLTVNKQTAKKIITQESSFEISGEGYKPEGTIFKEVENDLGSDERQYLKELASFVSIDNEANLSKKEVSNGEEWSYSGDPVDIAFLAMAYKAGVVPEKCRKEVEITAEIPFESEIKFSARFYREKGNKMVAAKGAAEVIITVCSRAMTVKGEIVELDHSKALSMAEKLSSEGYRVIAVAGADDYNSSVEVKRNPGIEDLPTMTLMAIVGFIDPVRPDVKKSVQKAIEAGIKVLMITGDNPDTALTIASDIGIARDKNELVTGHELEELVSDIDSAGNERERYILEKQAGEKLKDKKVFARVVPHQKLRIVEIFRKTGNFVAVTGDGVNDSPALKAANIGVAMGSGTDVTKDTASIILVDDSFSSIIAGVEEGRFAYDNIRKVIYLLVSTGIAELLLFILAISLGLPIALIAIQLLWLNMVTNGIQGAALAFEKGEPEAMKRKPRPPSEGIFNRLMLEETVLSALLMTGVTFGLWVYLINNRWGLNEARNLLLLLMVIFQNMHAFNCRSEKISAFRVPISRNYFLILGVFGALGLHIAVMYIPFMQELLLSLIHI